MQVLTISAKVIREKYETPLRPFAPLRETPL
jgi:hypothetical protein